MSSRKRYSRLDGCAGSRPTGDTKARTDAECALFHALQPEMLIGFTVCARAVEAASVIDDAQGDRFAVELEFQSHNVGLRVPDRVADGFVADTQELLIDFRSQSGGVAGDGLLESHVAARRQGLA